MPRSEGVHVQELEPLHHGPALRLRLHHVREDDVVLEALHGVGALVPSQGIVRPVPSELLVVPLVVNLGGEEEKEGKLFLATLNSKVETRGADNSTRQVKSVKR